MPSSPGYKRKYGQELAAQKKKDATKSDPNGTRFRSATNKKRAQLKKKGKAVKGKHVVHVGKPAKSGGKKMALGPKRANLKNGGKIGNRKGKSNGGKKGRRNA
jgi:hypothetical protein